MDGDLRRRNAQELRHDGQIDALELLAVPDLAFLFAEAHHAIERLHGRMGQIGELVGGFKNVSGGGEGGVCITDCPG